MFFFAISNKCYIFVAERVYLFLIVLAYDRLQKQMHFIHILADFSLLCIKHNFHCAFLLYERTI